MFSAGAGVFFPEPEFFLPEPEPEPEVKNPEFAQHYEFLIMLLAGLQCSKRCQFNNCFVFFCHGEQNNSYETFVKAYTVNIVHFPNPVGKIAISHLYQATNVGFIFFAHTSSRWVDR